MILFHLNESSAYFNALLSLIQCITFSKLANDSDFILDFGKLPFSLHLGKNFMHFGKIITKIHKIGKIKTIFGFGMTPL